MPPPTSPTGSIFQHHDFAARVERVQNFLGFFIGIFVVKLGRDDGAVADVVIDVGRDEIVRLDARLFRLGQHHQLQFSPLWVGGGGQDVVGLEGGDRSRVAPVDFFAHLHHDLPRLDEARQRVDVVVGDVCARDTGCPDHLPCAQSLQQHCLDFGL